MFVKKLRVENEKVIWDFKILQVPGFIVLIHSFIYF